MAQWQFGNSSYDTVLAFGDKNDRVIETVGTKGNGRFELGYYNGNDKAKAIVNVSPAVGCSVGCKFCDLTDVGLPLNADDILWQVIAMVEMVREIDGVNLEESPLKVNFAKTGEPSFNRQIPTAMELIAAKFKGVSFKYSTSAPNIPNLLERVGEVAKFANGYKAGSVQLQVSLISTDEEYRHNSAKPGMLAPIAQVRNVIDVWRNINPHGRTANCSLLVGENTPCEPEQIMGLITPEMARFRIRKIIPTKHSDQSGIVEASSATIQRIITRFREFGYNISDAGIPTPTEAEYSLASNVTRRRLGQEILPHGVINNPADFAKNKPASSWAENVTSQKRSGQNGGVGSP